MWMSSCSPGDAGCLDVDALVVVVWQNAELFTLAYGAIVRKLLTDCEDMEEVDKQLNRS